jgi:multidrug efflux system membrane fusion protein
MPEDILNKQVVGAPPVPPDHQLPPAHVTPPRRAAWVRVAIWALILLAFAAIFWFVLFRKGKQAPTPSGRAATTGEPVTITAATARKGSIGVYLDAIGTVTPVYTDSITSQVTGLISSVHYTEGQIVKLGDPLIDIDPRPYQAQLLQAQGALERDTNLLAQAKMDESRYQQAWAGDGVARQTLEDQEKVVLQDEGTVKVDQGTVQYDEVQVGFCHITAPIPGRVGLRLVDPGNVVQANSTTPLVVITQLQPITVVFTIAEDNIGQVQDQMEHGKTLQVTAYDRTDQSKIATGKLQTIDNQIDTTTGTLKLRAIFQNENNKLFPNLFVNTKLLVRTLEGVTLVPTSAIQQNGDTSFVYAIQNGTANLRNIKPGVSDSGQTVVQGIQPGDVVANSSFEKLQNGVKVNASQTPPPTTAPQSNAP